MLGLALNLSIGVQAKAARSAVVVPNEMQFAAKTESIVIGDITAKPESIIDSRDRFGIGDGKPLVELAHDRTTLIAGTDNVLDRQRNQTLITAFLQYWGQWGNLHKKMMSNLFDDYWRTAIVLKCIFDPQCRSSVVVVLRELRGACDHFLQIMGFNRYERATAFSIDDRLRVQSCSFGTLGSCIRSLPGINETFANQMQLNPEQSKLSTADNYEPKSEKSRSIMRHPVPSGFVWLTVCVFIIAFVGTLCLCRLTRIW